MYKPDTGDVLKAFEILSPYQRRKNSVFYIKYIIQMVILFKKIIFVDFELPGCAQMQTFLVYTNISNRKL